MGVAQSFPLLETLRLFLREELQSLKGKTLPYTVVKVVLFKSRCVEVESYFAEVLGGYQRGRTSRRKIRAVTGPMYLNFCNFSESSWGVFDWARRLVSVP